MDTRHGDSCYMVEGPVIIRTHEQHRHPIITAYQVAKENLEREATALEDKAKELRANGVRIVG